jgi:hypothetical protein
MGLVEYGPSERVASVGCYIDRVVQFCGWSLIRLRFNPHLRSRKCRLPRLVQLLPCLSWLVILLTSQLVPGDAGRQGTLIYVVIVETKL